MNKNIRNGLKLGIFILGFALFFAFVMMASGSTFGARCSKIHDEDTIEWDHCVERLNAGKSLS